MRWVGRLRVTLRATHVPGDKLFVDYAGPTVPVIDAAAGETRPAQIFVAVLGASNHTFTRQSQSDPLGSLTYDCFVGGDPSCDRRTYV